MQMSLPRGKINAFIYSSCQCLGCCDYKVRKGRRGRNPNHKNKTMRNHRI